MIELALVAVVALVQGAPSAADPAPFSMAKPGGSLPAGWTPLALPKVPAPQFALVADEGVTVLRSTANAAAGTVSHPLAHDVAARPMLRWRWKVDRVVQKADLATKAGDDFAARVYVFFDIPADSLPMAQRMRILLARNVYGATIPTAALCYVWDNRHAPGTTRWNPYTERVRTVVLRSAAPGEWADESRDLEADFREAFGAEWKAAVPPVTGIAAGNDTDQTGERVVAWFGDFRFGRRP